MSYMAYIEATKPKPDIWPIFHQLWGKAVGTPNYDKKDWQSLERKILDLIWD